MNLRLFCATLAAEQRNPISHGSPIEGSVLRSVVMALLVAYATTLYVFDLVEGQAREAVLMMLSISPVFIFLSVAHTVFILVRPKDQSVARVMITSGLDNGYIALIASHGTIFYPFTVLLPWIAIVHGVRFGPAWLITSTFLGEAGLLLVLLTGEKPAGQEAMLEANVFIVVIMTTFVLTSVYCHRVLRRLRQNQEHLESVTIQDQQTGIGNRNYLGTQLTRAISLAYRIHRHVGVIYFELRGLDKIANLYGEMGKEDVLLDIVRTLSGNLRNVDTFARTGDTSFVIVVEGLSDEHGLRRVAEIVCGQVAQIAQLRGQEKYLSVSLGTSFFDESMNKGSVDPEALIAAAACAMSDDTARGVAIMEGKSKAD